MAQWYWQPTPGRDVAGTAPEAYWEHYDDAGTGGASGFVWNLSGDEPYLQISFSASKTAYTVYQPSRYLEPVNGVDYSFIDTALADNPIEVLIEWERSNTSGDCAIAFFDCSAWEEFWHAGYRRPNSNQQLGWYAAYNQYTSFASAAKTITANVRYRTRARLDGQTFTVRTWQASLQEPETWDLTTTRDRSFYWNSCFPSGEDGPTFSLAIRPSGATVVKIWKHSVGTNGDPAPLAPVEQGILLAGSAACAATASGELLDHLLNGTALASASASADLDAPEPADGRAHRYWRVACGVAFITETSTVVAVVELQLEHLGVNWLTAAMVKGGNHYLYEGPPLAKVTDGDDGTVWFGGIGPPVYGGMSWLQIDAGAPAKIDRIRIKHRYPNPWYGALDCPTTVHLFWSDAPGADPGDWHLEAVWLTGGEAPDQWLERARPFRKLPAWSFLCAGAGREHNNLPDAGKASWLRFAAAGGTSIARGMREYPLWDGTIARYFELETVATDDATKRSVGLVNFEDSFGSGLPECASYPLGYYRGDGRIEYDATVRNTGVIWSNGDRVGIALDTSGRLWFLKNGVAVEGTVGVAGTESFTVPGYVLSDVLVPAWDGGINSTGLIGTAVVKAYFREHELAYLPAGFHGLDYGRSVPMFEDTLSSGLGLDDSAAPGVAKIVREAIGVGEVLASLPAAVLRDRIGFASAPSTHGSTQHLALTEGLGLAGRARTGVVDAVQDGVGLGGALGLATRALPVVRGAVGLGDTLASNAASHATVAEALGLSAATSRAFAGEASTRIGLAAASEAWAVLRDLLGEAVGLDSSTTGQLRLALALEDTLGLDDAQTLAQRLGEIIASGVGLGGLLRWNDAVYTAWVVNAETLALSEYQGYPFQSFAPFGATSLGATDSGIYELEGADDDGVAIAAAIRTGLLDFGSSRRKAMPVMYLGYTASGRLVLKAIQTDEGRKTEHWYELRETRGAPDTARIKVGKGLRARYWSFELANAAGADFALDAVQLHPVVLERRL